MSGLISMSVLHWLYPPIFLTCCCIHAVYSHYLLKYGFNLWESSPAAFVIDCQWSKELNNCIPYMTTLYQFFDAIRVYLGFLQPLMIILPVGDSTVRPSPLIRRWECDDMWDSPDFYLKTTSCINLNSWKLISVLQNYIRISFKNSQCDLKNSWM